MAYLSKADELQILDRAIADLGQQSYLGPYFADVRAEIIRDITSDFMPTSDLPAAARRQAEQIRTQAEAEAGEIRAAAGQTARKLIDQAGLAAGQINARAYADLRRALKCIGGD